MVPESLVEVSSGEDIILKCQASGNPIPKIKWMKKEKEVSLENHLKISNSKPIDQGVYECIASNEIGRAIKEMIDGGKIKREDLFVVTKVAHTFHRYDRAILAVERSLHNLSLKYIDLVLIHFPVGFQEGEDLWPVDSKGHIITSDIDYLETWRGLEETVNRKWVVNWSLKL